MTRKLLLAVTLIGVGLASGAEVGAQGYGPARYARRPMPLPRPAVSPYLNLLQQENSLEGVPTYQTLVRPIIEQRRLNQYQANQFYTLQQQVARNAVSAAPYEQIRGTGHITTYQNLSHYFPGLTANRR